MARTVIIYTAVFGVMRLMGKRQLSDMQPFDLVVSLLIADSASAPITDGSIPLLYGLVPVLTLFLLHGFAAKLAMKSEPVRRIVNGSPVMLIREGVILEDALKAVSMTVFELFEQLRLKDVFSPVDVKYCIMETNGSLSAMKKEGGTQAERPSVLAVTDGAVVRGSLEAAGLNERELEAGLKKYADVKIKECLYVCIESDGRFVLQIKEGSRSGVPVRLSIGGAGG
ncbi:MAG: DUF421 domain-containing protein [Clostridia bacterium]|nr:DUF421 domain-containing protein [Clostridia bacterium]